MELRNILKGTAVVATVAFFSGCATNIAKLPVTARDNQVYENKFLKKSENYDAMKVVIIPQNPAIDGADTRTLTNLKSLTASFSDHLETAFSNLKDFEVVPRSEVGALMADDNFTGEESSYKATGVNFAVVYRVSSYNFEQFQPLLGGKDAPPHYNAYVKVKITLLNKVTGKKMFTKTVTGKSGSSSDSPTIGLLNSALEGAVKDFSTQFAVDYAPPAVVQQTKGSGKAALLNVGKDYGLMKNMKVEFFTIKVKQGKERKIPFAYGKIIEVAEEGCWVIVDDFEEAGVKENHFARVRKDQSKSFLEAVSLD